MALGRPIPPTCMRPSANQETCSDGSQTRKRPLSEEEKRVGRTMGNGVPFLGKKKRIFQKSACMLLCVS